MIRTVAMAVGSTQIKQVQETMKQLQSRTVADNGAPQGRGTIPYTVQYSGVPRV